MKIAYIEKRKSPAALRLIEQASEIIEEYVADGYTLTLRQLYYQFVARGLVENTKNSYKCIQSHIADGRLMGLIDWSAIEDRTRSVRANTHFTGPRDGMTWLREIYGIDMWANQPQRVEVWIEKDALLGVIASVCSELDVPYFSCRGFSSLSEMWRGAQRMISSDVETVVLHLGDHDPSGVDMSRDNEARLRLFGAVHTFKRIALNMDQIDRLHPPPNPAKMTDSRSRKYITEFGHYAWELDALEPRYIESLIREHINMHRDHDLWTERQAELDEHFCVFDDLNKLAQRGSL